MYVGEIGRKRDTKMKCDDVKELCKVFVPLKSVMRCRTSRMDAKRGIEWEDRCYNCAVLD